MTIATQRTLYTDGEKWERDRASLGVVSTHTGFLSRLVRCIVPVKPEKSYYMEVEERLRVQEAMDRRGPTIAPPGGRVVILSVPVDESRRWDEAAHAGAPDGLSDDILRVGEEYPANTGITVEAREIILVNFGNPTRGEAILRWAKKQRVCSATPRECFAVGEYYPSLNKVLGMNHIGIILLNPCCFGFFQGLHCIVWWFGAERHASLAFRVGDWYGDDDWLAFVHDMSIVTP